MKDISRERFRSSLFSPLLKTFISVRESQLSDKETGKGGNAGRGMVAKLLHIWKGHSWIMERLNS
jgi:hypothetical protein